MSVPGQLCILLAYHFDSTHKARCRAINEIHYSKKVLLHFKNAEKNKRTVNLYYNDLLPQCLCKKNPEKIAHHSKISV